VNPREEYELAQRKTVLTIGTIRKDGKIAAHYGKLSKIRTTEQIITDIASDHYEVRYAYKWMLDQAAELNAKYR
jgi:hypothetical protein